VGVRVRLGATLAMVLVATAAAVGSPADSEQARRMIANKVSLLEMLITAPLVRSPPAGLADDAAALAATGRGAIEGAEAAVAEGRISEAMALLDDALALVSAASRGLTAASRAGPEATHQRSLVELGKKLAMYRDSVAEIAQHGRHRAQAEALLEKMDAMKAEAMQRAEAGDLADASRQMTVAYRTAIEELARMQSGEEIVLTLEFATPADEYSYELRRYESSRLMVEMMLREEPAGSDRRAFVDRQVGEGEKLKAQSEARAKAGGYEDANRYVEQAIRHLNRALQAMGVPAY
jgi:hypothetical protein